MPAYGYTANDLKRWDATGADPHAPAVTRPRTITRLQYRRVVNMLSEATGLKADLEYLQRELARVLGEPSQEWCRTTLDALEADTEPEHAATQLLGALRCGICEQTPEELP